MLFPCLRGCAVPTPNNKSNNFFSFFLCNCKNMFYFCIVKTTRSLSYGVIGNTTDSGPVIPGSSPGSSTRRLLEREAAFFVALSKLGRLLSIILLIVCQVAYKNENDRTPHFGSVAVFTPYLSTCVGPTATP